MPRCDSLIGMAISEEDEEVSLILDALNKADRDRDNSDKVPDLNTYHVSRSSAARQQRWLILLSVLVVMLLFALGVSTYLWMGGDSVGGQGQAQQSASPSSQAAAVAPKALPRPAPIKIQTPAAPPRAVADTEVEALYQAEQGDIQIVEPVVRAADSEPLRRQSSVDEALARSLWQDAQIKPLPQPAAAKVIAPEPAKPEPVDDEVSDAAFADTLASVADMPYLHELSTNLQNTIPTLMYAEHTFAEGVVVINKKRLVAGDAIAAGLVVEQIMADGIVLSFKGERFKLDSLSSWVNY